MAHQYQPFYAFTHHCSAASSSSSSPDLPCPALNSNNNNYHFNYAAGYVFIAPDPILLPTQLLFYCLDKESVYVCPIAVTLLVTNYPSIHPPLSTQNIYLHVI